MTPAWIVILVVLVVVLVLAVAAMRRGWRNRVARQSADLPAFREPPESAWQAEPLLAPAKGVYVGSAFAGDWQDRVAAGGIGLRAAAEFRLTGEGLLIERAGAAPLWIRAIDIVGARADRALAGKVMGGPGLLVVRWRHGEREIDTGLRGDDRSVYGEWIEAVGALAGESGSTRGGVKEREQ